jgi:hypothetical protein
MADFPSLVLTGQTVSQSYLNLLEYSGSTLLVKANGNLFQDLSNFLTTSSFATASTHPITASWAVSASAAVSASWAAVARVAESASWASASYTASFLSIGTYFITASQAVSASHAGSASHAISASWAPFTDTGTVLFTGSTYQITASHAISASWAPGVLTTGSLVPITASWAEKSTSASFATRATTADTSTSSSFAPMRTLDELTDVAITDVLVDEFLGYNGVEWINRHVPIVGGGATQTYFLSTQSYDGANNKMLSSPQGGTETSSIVTVNDSIGFIKRFITPDPIGSAIPGGIWGFHTFGAMSSGTNTGTTEIITRVNKVISGSTGDVSITGTGTDRTASFTGVTPLVPSDTGSQNNILTATLIQTPTGTGWISVYSSSAIAKMTWTDAAYVNESNVPYSLYYLQFTSSTGDIAGSSVQSFEQTTVRQEISMSLTDKLCFAYFGKTDNAANKTLDLYFGGTQRYTHVDTPVIVAHNDLPGLQGGTADEYYHLTQGTYNRVQSNSASFASSSISSSFSNFAVSASWAPGSTPGTTLVKGSIYYITSSWAVSASWAPGSTPGTIIVTGSLVPITASWAESSSVAISASWAPGSTPGTIIVTGSLVPITASWAGSASWAPASPSDTAISASWASSSLSASYFPNVKSLVLCTAYTPTSTGADAAELVVPYHINGTTALSWSVSRLNFRAQLSGSSYSSVVIEKSITNTAFSAVALGPVTLSANTYEGVTTGSLGNVNSGDKIRFNVATLGTATNWTIITEIAR